MSDYLKFWGLAKPVFKDLNAELGIFVPASVQSLVARLRMFADHEGHFIAVTAPHGHGKTTLAKWLYHGLTPKKHEAILLSLFEPETKAGWLFPKLAAFLGGDNNTAAVQKIAEGIDEIKAEGRRLVILIDEAHKLKTGESLEELHALISMQEAAGAGINIFLFGNADLLTTLQAHHGVMSRVTFQANFPELNQKETKDYLDYRLIREGLTAGVFTADASEAVFQLSQGVYSVVNALAENCLVEAAMKRKRKVDRSLVEQSAVYLPKGADVKAPPQVAPLRPTVQPLRALNDAKDIPTEIPPPQSPNVIPKAEPKTDIAREANKSQDKAQTKKQEDLQPSISLSSLFYKNKAK